MKAPWKIEATYGKLAEKGTPYGYSNEAACHKRRGEAKPDGMVSSTAIFETSLHLIERLGC